MAFWKRLGRPRPPDITHEPRTATIVDAGSHRLVSDLRPRELADVEGVVRAVTVPPENRVPELVAELTDGSAPVVLVWLGRREIRGIGPGVALRVRGRLCERRGRLTMFNPDYEILPPGSGAGQSASG